MDGTGRTFMPNFFIAIVSTSVGTFLHGNMSKCLNVCFHFILPTSVGTYLHGNFVSILFYRQKKV